MLMKNKILIFVCLLNLVPAINLDLGIKAMDYSRISCDLCLNKGESSQSFEKFDNTQLEDKKNYE